MFIRINMVCKLKLFSYMKLWEILVSGKRYLIRFQSSMDIYYIPSLHFKFKYGLSNEIVAVKLI